MCSQKNHKSKFHGYSSIIFFFIAIGTGIFAISEYSISLALINAFSVLVMILSVSSYYCSKCTSRENCSHWIFGKISSMISIYKNEKYNTFDIVFGTILPIIVVILLPQYWLLKASVLFIIYWSFLAIAGLQVLGFVCTKCENYKCSICRNKLRSIQAEKLKPQSKND